MSLTCSNEIRYNADVKKVSDNCSEKYKSKNKTSNILSFDKKEGRKRGTSSTNHCFEKCQLFLSSKRDCFFSLKCSKKT